MLTPKKVYAALKTYTDESIAGGGAIKGKNCVIQSITDITGGHRVTFQWTLDDDTEQTGTMDVMDGSDGSDGSDGVGVASVSVNSSNHLIVTYTDSTTEDAGEISVIGAVDSVNGQTGDVTISASDLNVYTKTEADGLLADKVDWESNGVLGAKNLFNDNDIETGIAWNGSTNTARARIIIPIESSTSYILSMHGTNGLDYMGYILSETEIPSGTALTTISSFPTTITTGASDVYLIIGFNKTSIAVSDVTALKLMLRLSTDTDSTYQPYTMTNRELTESKMTYADNGVLGAKNLLENKGTTRTVNDVTFTVNADKSVTVNGATTTNAAIFYLNSLFSLEEGKRYILSDGLSEHNTNRFLRIGNASDGYLIGTGTGDNVVFTATATMTARISVEPNTTVNNLTFKPMLRLATDTDSTYVPYAKTNRELTEEVSISSSAFTDAIGTVSNNYLYKQSASVMGILELNSVTASADDVIAILPSGYRPPNDFTLPLGAPNGKSVRIQSGGNVVSLSELSSVNIRFGGSWLSI